MTSSADQDVNPLGAVFAGFDAADVRWCVLRGEAFLAAPHKDVDLLVAADDLDSAEDVVFALNGVALPKRLHPWHRFYLVPDPDDAGMLTLDVVTALIYSRRRRLVSKLENGCLARRERRGAAYVLNRTDAFWTVLLHCVLDKQDVAPRRAAELEAAIDVVERPSDGEEFFAKLCPPTWSADRALSAVRARDWAALAELGRMIIGIDARAPDRKALSTLRAAASRISRQTYVALWRRAGLGATPLALDVVDAAGVDALVVDVRRTPGCRDVALLVAASGRLAAQLRSTGYFRIAGWWVRATPTGIERVRILPAQGQGMSSGRFDEVFAAARPLGGRIHCRRPFPPQAVALSASTAALSRS